MSIITNFSGSALGVSLESASSVFEIIDRGTRREQQLAFVSAPAFLIGGGVVVASIGEVLPHNALFAGIGIIFFAVVTLASATASYDYRKQRDKNQAVNDLEERVKNEPDKPKLAWLLAQEKLESYLDRNLRQVSSIFYLTAFVMLIGMGFIGLGVWKSLNDPNKIEPAALAALAGVVIQIIGGTILLIFRSTMSQAKGYVNVLERINAVGMSINILEGIESSNEMRDKARLALSANLLRLYDTKVGSVASPDEMKET
ncbi:TRADD-N-associated membrane domain-containing protein [Sphingobium cupriresistens]|uniref:Cyanobacterial TRADD-N associated 2 transmembrane domain-containing protein n=1 Tax=Sphingobium cupriresistens LL01 TaxID=1420583 RepID=A0A0J8AH77_9SPHN|nr:hypothetical protein [Sphingobium cupriresistens]KMS54185.1 hypothetical protein V473_17875 [Sphingobium cupriresistens LL01]